MLRRLYDWVIRMAEHPKSLWVLAGVSFAESSFFPIPPDLMLGPMAAMEPSKWLRYAFTCTVASVLGGLLGYAIGMFLMESIGGAILNFFGYAGERRAELEALYAEWGAWVIFIKGLTPIPYKLVTIVSGALAYPLHWFVIASILTRGARFLAVAWIFQRFGPQIAPVLEKRLGLVLIVVAVAIIAAVIALRYLH
jgi:membrane protein YqaA with SNARE-associated domain